MVCVWKGGGGSGVYLLHAEVDHEQCWGQRLREKLSGARLVSSLERDLGGCWHGRLRAGGFPVAHLWGGGSGVAVAYLSCLQKLKPHVPFVLTHDSPFNLFALLSFQIVADKIKTHRCIPKLPAAHR